MDQHDIEIALMREPFIAGSGALPFLVKRLWKMAGGLVCLCRRGTAKVNIGIKEYTIGENTQVLLIPGTIFYISETSDDLSLSYLCFSHELFQEACLHMEAGFITFLQEYPCYTLPGHATLVADGLLRSAEAIYQDKKNRYRVPLAKNHLQSLLLDIYDKYHRFHGQQETTASNRQNELFKSFIMLLNEYSTSEREVTFYARQLGISTKYLSGICQHLANMSAKAIIDDFAILQIKMLLQSTELSIVEIADRLRFPDQSYMGRYFKRHEGITPKEYRTGKSEGG